MSRKNLLSFLALMLFVISSAQEGIRFENLSFKEILAKAKKENKIVFLDAYASWCGPCKLMEKNVFTDAAVKDFYNSNFINSHFDMEKGEGVQLAQKYQVRSYPTFLYLNGDGEVVFRGMGYMAAPEFIAMGKEANNPFNKRGSLKDQFEKGEKNPEFLKNAVKVYANSDPEFAKKASERYFKFKKDKTFTQEEISMLLYFLKSADDPNYTVFKNSKEEIVKVLPLDLYNQFDNQLRLSKLVQKVVDPAKKSIDENLFLSEASKIVSAEEAKAALNRLKLSFYPSVENFTAYEKTALEYFKDGDGFSADELFVPAFLFSEKISNPASLKKAVVWAEKAVMNRETAENAFILTKLYAKTGNAGSAKNYGEMALRLAQQAGSDTTMIQNFLGALK